MAIEEIYECFVENSQTLFEEDMLEAWDSDKAYEEFMTLAIKLGLVKE